MLQEVAFVAGPLVAGAVIGRWSTTAAVAVSAGLTLVGGIAFATSAAARGRAAQRRQPRSGLATTSGMLTVLMSAAAMLALAVIAGLCLAPVTTTQIAVLDQVAPRERPAEAFSWLAILYGAGSAAGAALGGQLVSADGPRAAIVAA